MNKPIKFTSILFLIFLISVLLISSCANETPKKDVKDANPVLDKNPVFCNSDSDCKVKDVHNCCGYFPKCVNKDYVPDIAAVERECKEKSITSICGFSDIKSCACSEHKCIAVQENSN